MRLLAGLFGLLALAAVWTLVFASPVVGQVALAVFIQAVTRGGA